MRLPLVGGRQVSASPGIDRSGPPKCCLRTAAQLVALGEGVERWALPVFCVTEFLRAVTRKRVFNPPSPVAQAADFIEAVVASPGCEVVQPGAEFMAWLLTTAREADSHGNLMFDAQIAAVCREQGIDGILRNDSDFQRFDALQVQRLE